LFVGFFYALRAKGVPVTPTSFLKLQQAIGMGLVNSLEDFYTTARSILIKSERYFDTYDRVFANIFKGVAITEPDELELTEIARSLLQEWLNNPGAIARALGLDEKELEKYSPEELLKYFMERLKDQTGQHHGGGKWIGTGGTSPVGHSGYHPGGMRVGGESRNKSAIKVALERRYKDYSQEGPLTEAQIGEALKRLRMMVPSGPKDVVNIEKTIYETMRNAGEIEIIFDRRLTDRLKIILMIDNGGWSMDPYIEVVKTLFNYARSQFKDLHICYFHNTIYDQIWFDPQRLYRPESVDDLIRRDPETRIIIVGDASMAPYELTHPQGAIYINQRQALPSIERLKFLAKTFRHAVWLNPQTENIWHFTWTIAAIREVFPMFELTLDGLEKAILHLMAKN
jgi:uncharacterized protein with von Willebrand factor type A (vWA) domain